MSAGSDPDAQFGFLFFLCVYFTVPPHMGKAGANLGTEGSGFRFLGPSPEVERLWGGATSAVSGAVSWCGGSVAGPRASLLPCPQVPFFLFIVFVVYTLLPFSMRGAIVAGGVSSISHLLVLGVLMGAFTKPSDWVVRQVRCAQGSGGGAAAGLVWPEDAEMGVAELVLRPQGPPVG